jgi:endo-1,4-beta-xylanase
MVIRRHLAALLTFSILTGGGACRAQTLRQVAEKIGLLVGTAVNPALFSQPEYAKTLTAQFNMVEPENQMKWAATEPSHGVFDFRAGDRVVQFAQARSMKVRGHNLLWGKYNPVWLKRGRFTPPQLCRIMKNHIQMVVRHYRGQVFAWDVVNEALDSEGHLRHTVWYDEPGIGLAGKGTAYIAQAFRWAHQADPQALLFYNEVGADGINARSDAMYEMVKDFKRLGVPISGVGLQMHVFNRGDILSQLARNIARFTKLGVEVQITEMDVALPVAGDSLASNSRLEWQAKIYRSVATACAENPGCTAFQMWGFTDRYSWIPGYTQGKRGAALIFSAEYRPKPAYQAVVEAFQRVLKSNPQLKEQRLQFDRGVAVQRR